MDKTITIKGQTWQKLMELKISHQDRSLGDVIQRLLARKNGAPSK